METIFIYLLLSFSFVTLNDMWGQLDFTYLLPRGEAYDFFFVVALIVGGILLVSRYRIIKITNDIKVMVGAFGCIVLYCMLNGIYCVVSGTQGIVATALVLREVLYLGVVAIFLVGKYNPKRAVQLLTILDCIGCVIAIAEVVVGPVSPLRVNGKYEVGVSYWRSYSDVPMLAFFLCPLLIYGLGAGQYLFGKWIDCILLLLLVTTKILKMSRVSIFALIVVCGIAFLLCKGKDWKSIVKQLLWMMGLGVLGIGMIAIVMPELFVRFKDGIMGVLHLEGASNISADTMSYRWATMRARWNYLLKHQRMLWGMGPLHNDLPIDLEDNYNWINNDVVAPDITYGAMLLRYGVIGGVVFVGNLLAISVMAWKNTNIVMKSFGLFILASLIEGITSHSSLAFGAFLKIGILFGIAWKSVSVVDQNGEKIYEGGTH